MIKGIEPIGRPNKLAGQIAERLRAMILSGELLPHDKLPTEKELCDAFGVGRSSVREALQSLEYLGLVDSKPGVGRFLAADAPSLLESLNWNQTVQQASVFELMEVRRQLEVMAAGLAAQRATAAGIAALNQLLERMQTEIEDPDAFLATELGFHLALARACGNVVLAEIVTLLIQKVAGQAEDFMRTLPYTRDATLQQFGQIARALAVGDPASAAAGMQEHLGLVRDVLTLALPEQVAVPPSAPTSENARQGGQR
jgi:GntR family transcriptional repressor for pyruvate dehydrogenase complex